jgi:hypothetical protein
MHRVPLPPRDESQAKTSNNSSSSSVRTGRKVPDIKEEELESSSSIDLLDNKKKLDTDKSVSSDSDGKLKIKKGKI